MDSEYTDGALVCFYIANMSNHKLQEIVYWPVKDEISRIMSLRICDCSSTHIVKGYKFGFTSFIKLREDIDNSNTNAILEYECNAGLLKCEIAIEFHKTNFPNVSVEFINKLNIYWNDLSLLCELHKSIMMGLLNLTHAIEKIYRMPHNTLVTIIPTPQGSLTKYF